MCQWVKRGREMMLGVQCIDLAPVQSMGWVHLWYLEKELQVLQLKQLLLLRSTPVSPNLCPNPFQIHLCCIVLNCILLIQSRYQKDYGSGRSHIHLTAVHLMAVEKYTKWKRPEVSSVNFLACFPSQTQHKLLNGR